MKESAASAVFDPVFQTYTRMYRIWRMKRRILRYIKDNETMKTRILTAICMGLVFVPAAIFSDTHAYSVLFAILGAMGAFELLRCIGLHKHLLLTAPAMALGAAFPLIAKSFPDSAPSIFTVCTLALMFWVFAVSLFSKGAVPIDISGLAFLGLTYIVWGFGTAVQLREMTHGAYLFLLPFLGAWMSDIFAYFTGRLFGKHKLIPDVSPKKTVEGAVGGIFFAMLAFVAFGYVASRIGGVTPNYIALFLLGLPVSLVSIVGDLVMSLIKRRFGVKDYSNIFPGHGGVLDRFDSVLATSITLYLLCAHTPFFGMLFA